MQSCYCKCETVMVWFAYHTETSEHKKYIHINRLRKWSAGYSWWLLKPSENEPNQAKISRQAKKRELNVVRENNTSIHNDWRQEDIFPNRMYHTVRRSANIGNNCYFISFPPPWIVDLLDCYRCIVIRGWCIRTPTENKQATVYLLEKCSLNKDGWQSEAGRNFNICSKSRSESSSSAEWNLSGEVLCLLKTTLLAFP